MGILEILIHYFMITLLSIILIKVFEKYANIKINFNKATIFKMLIMSILFFLNNLFMFNIIKTIFSFLLTFIFFKWFYNEKSNKTAYYTIMLTIILYIIDLLASLFIPLGINNIEALNNNLLFKVTFSICVNFIFYFVATNKYVVRLLKKYENFSLSNKMYYLLGFIGIFTCNFWLFYMGIHTADKILSGIVCFTELVIVILLMVTIFNQYEKKVAKIKEDQIKQNLKLYSKIASEYKELKHNLMNDFLIVKSKVSKKDQEFMNEIINKYKTNYEWVNDVTDIPEGLQGLVFLKKNQAELKNIQFNLEYHINKQIEKDYHINSNFRLYEALGIIFDNAIEAAYESKEKIINVVFSYNKKLQISVLNTFNNDIDLDQIGNKDYTTKKRGSGIGLNYIKRQKNKFTINQNIQDNIFITDIIIDS